VTKKDGPVTKKDGPVTKKDGPVTKKDGPVTKKDGPVTKKDGPVTKKDGPITKKDGPVTKKDGPVVDQKTVKPDQKIVKPDAAVFSCPPLGLKTMVINGNGSGDWTVALEPKTTYKNLGFSTSAAKFGAAVADYNVNWQQAAGFIVSMPSSAKSAAAESSAALKNLGSGLYGKQTTTSSGAKATSHDGYDMVASTVIAYTAASTADVSTVRNKVLQALLSNATITLTGLPGVWGVPDTGFVIRFSTLLRSDGRVIHIGAVTDAKGDADISKLTGTISADLAGATGLARAGKTTAGMCDKIAVGKGNNKVDFIWVMDESGSMAAERANIASNAATLWAEAKAVGLDFRMGVTNVVNPTGTYKNCMGRFCTAISTDPYSTKGTDRFLLPTEQKIFAACINNPPCYEGGSEYGLVNAKKAVELHLPRAANTPTKIRTGAQVVIVVATDEVPNSMSSMLGGTYSTCTLKSSTQTKVNAHLKTNYLDYFAGKTTKDAKIDYFHVFGGVCKNTCQAQVAHGYKEVAAKFNGKVYDLCQKSYTSDLKKLIQKIVISGSPLKLTKSPIVASIQVSINNKAVSRSKLNGYDYVASQKSLILYGSASPKVGTNVVISYRNWK